MSNKNCIEDSIFIASASKIDQIIRPIVDTVGISIFRYLRIYYTGKRIVLCNVPDFTRYTYVDNNFLHLWFDGENPELLKPGWSQMHMNLLMDDREVTRGIYSDFVNCFHSTYGMDYIHIADDFYEVFTFTSNTRDIYLVNTSTLIKFIIYFREKAHKLLIDSEQESCLWIPPKPFSIQETSNHCDLDLDKLNVKRFYLPDSNHSVYITAQEYHIVQMLNEGLSAKEIANTKKINLKTAHKHLENIRLKLGCHKQTQIVGRLLKSGFSLMRP